MAMESYREQGMDAGAAKILEIEKDNPEVAGWPKCKFIILVSRSLWNKWSDSYFSLALALVANKELIFARPSSSNAVSVKR
jgi:hypothetical protein